jgi:density-regulated protein DRP1
MSEIEIGIEDTQKQIENVTIDEIQPLIVQYCDVCRFPLEYCEISHDVIFKKELRREERIQKEDAVENKPEGQAGKIEEKKEETEKTEKKDKKKKETLIMIEQSKRGKSKFTTHVSNLEKYGLVLKDIAKLFSKKFACSSTVTKEDNGTECITLTGEFGYEIVEFLVEKFPAIVKPELCKIVEPKKKAKE